MRALLLLVSLLAWPTAAAAADRVWLVAPEALRSAAGWSAAAGTYEVVALESLDPEALVAHAARGGSFIWIGPPDRLAADLWIGSFRPSSRPVRIEPAAGVPLDLGSAAFRPSHASAAFIRPTEEIPYHNVVEEPRANLLPLLVARDRFGTEVGYPAVLFSHYAPSLARGRFDGSRQVYFLFDDPAAALDAAAWTELIEELGPWFRSGLQVTHLRSLYASYSTGERVHVEGAIANRRGRAAALEVEFEVRAPGAPAFRRITRRRLVAAAREVLAAGAEFVPDRQGLWTVRARISQDLDRAEHLSAAGDPLPLERRDIAVLVHEGLATAAPVVAARGLNIELDGETAFLAGTHYYPSSSWWNGAWDDPRPLLMDRDFAAIRRAGYRLVRLWIDHVLDEASLRAMDAALLLAARHGLAVDLCIFTQWGADIAYQRPDGGMADVALRTERDFNVYGISFRNLDAQREYVGLLAGRWRAMPHVVFNLSNETYIRDPDPSQMDPEAQRWEESKLPLSYRRDTALFRRWAREMTAAIRDAGARQPVISGHTFADRGGGDSYGANRDGAFGTLHSYLDPAATAARLSYVDPACSNRPLVLEEFGTTGWNNAEHYDALVHHALAAGAAAALSYEWGVSWLTPHLPIEPTFLRQEWQDPDPRWFGAVGGFAEQWPLESSGFFPAASGFPYGSIYHGTPFPAEAARVIGRFDGFGPLLARGDRPIGVAVHVPETAGRDVMPKRHPHFQRLWERQVPYHVVQHDCVVPSGALRLSENGFDPRRLDALPSVQVTPSTVRLIARPTRSGVLYSVFGPAPHVSLRAEGVEASFGADPSGMLLIGSDGVLLAETSSRLVIAGRPVLSIDRGRLLVRAARSGSIDRAAALRLRASEPATVVFERPIRSVRVWRPGDAEPIAVEPASGPSLVIDHEMAAYDLEVEFR